MKTQSLIVVAALVLSTFSVRAQPVIETYSGGMLTWSNTAGPLRMYSVEWTHDLVSGQWKSDWTNQEVILTTQSVVSVPVPAAYRVAQGFDERAIAGAWVVTNPDGGLTILRMDGHGQIQMFGAYMSANPAGYYTISTSGVVDAHAYDSEEPIHFSARLLSPEIMQYTYMSVTGLALKVTNPSAMQGTWRGTIGPYTNVIMNVRSDGYIPGISNLIDVASGMMYRDISNRVAAAIWTGADCNDPWTALSIRAIMLNPTNIFGDYELDSDVGWFTAGVNLKKQ